MCNSNKIEEWWYVLGFYYDSTINQEGHGRGVALFKRHAYEGERFFLKDSILLFLISVSIKHFILRYYT